MALQAEENVSAPLPIWMSIPIILLCLAGGGWIIHWYVMTDPISHESTILGDPISQSQIPSSGFGPGLRPPRGNNARGVVQLQDASKGEWDLRTRMARADIYYVNGKTTYRTVAYLNWNFIPDDAKNTIFAVRSLVADTAQTTALKLTMPQIKQLRQLSQTIMMSMAPADREELSAAINTCMTAKPADRAAQETKLLQTLDEVAQKSMAATKQQAIDRAKQINAIITPDQWKQSAAMGGAK